jgi:hypothetical protein
VRILVLEAKGSAGSFADCENASARWQYLPSQLFAATAATAAMLLHLPLQV